MTAPNALTPLPHPTYPPGDRSVLILDDEPVIRMIARTSLAAAGFTVAEAGDSTAAYDLIDKAARPFDLILLDLRLGEVTGDVMIPVFRQKSPTTKILVVSGLGAEDVEGIGADGFLGKPFTKATLLITVWQTLASAPRPAPDNLK